MYLTIEDQYEVIKSLAELMKVTVKYVRFEDTRVGGRIDPARREIEINYLEATPLRVFCHEMGHQHCYDTGMFPALHHISWPLRTRKEFLALARTILRGEQWVDQWGKELFESIAPYNLWMAGYEHPWQKELIQDTLEQVRKEMRRPPPQTRTYKKLQSKRAQQRLVQNAIKEAYPEISSRLQEVLPSDPV